MEVERLRAQAISYIIKHYAQTGKAPSVQKICNEVLGLNRSNFYNIFKGIGEACQMADIPIPTKRIAHTRTASKKRSEKIIEPKFSLTEDQYNKINAIHYLESKSMHDVIDELIENDRILRREYKLNMNEMASLSKLLKKAEKEGLNIDAVLKLLNRYIKKGVHYLGSNELNIIDNIFTLVMLFNLDFNDLEKLYRSQDVVYRSGYEECIEDSIIEIEKELSRTMYHLETSHPKIIAHIVGNKLKMRSVSKYYDPPSNAQQVSGNQQEE